MLEVQGGALPDQKRQVAVVSAASIGLTMLTGEGWRLTLKPGWVVRRDARHGDLVLKEGGEAPR